ncbi:hypothetical protein GCM10010169_26350 [Micromonospora fulviviridis]|nr:hypothetical protein GCM10010169_26350 [Micromonospora fulviviridis]
MRIWLQSKGWAAGGGLTAEMSPSVTPLLLVSRDARRVARDGAGPALDGAGGAGRWPVR